MNNEIKSTTAEIQKYAVSMRKTAENIYRLLNNLLEWSQIQKGSFSFTPAVIGLRYMVDKSMNILIEFVKAKRIEISIDILDNLFRIDMKTNRKGTEGELSAGLGLQLCKEFIEKNGGKLWAESVVGIGSTFYFTLPFQSTPLRLRSGTYQPS